MNGQRKVFRIEATKAAERPSAVRYDSAPAFDHIISELKALRSLVQPREELNARMIESYKAQITEAQKLKGELDIIQEAITRTKHEIATLHVTGFEGPEMARVTDELDAIVTGTEQATETILAAAEFIDQTASNLGAGLKLERNQALTSDIQDQVIKIFEACNFQDLTGQRITKVVATLKFIETHIVRMIDIWGGLDAFKDLTPEAIAEREGDKKLLNGPKLEREAGHVSQDDIDALFN